MENVILFRLSIFVVIVYCVSLQRLDFQKQMEEKHFNFSNCNRTAVPLIVNLLEVTPDPIQFGGNVLVRLNLDLERDAGVNHNRIEVDFSLRLETKEGYTELCEIIGEAMCHYNDFCAVLKQYMEHKKCEVPPSFKFNCSCPFLKNEYNIIFPVKVPTLSFGLRGTFDMTINIHEEGKVLGCVEIHFCVTNCEPLGSEEIKKRTQMISTTP
ncbi:ganglioside GM2 activator-like isoform X2 [Mercenaria mercenaria]|uniref:ganglioside GM2 activator-like isoform X2 n=1 Tax=Mercenaria mercenaria TaxID=6596 RepID=UPI00234F9382|nr:ganglioside GM2 activator-like isoform X2 [Mercenaria mercenaria]